jgi:hypothetical protein
MREQVDIVMGDLIFLPIEIDIISTSYFVDKQASDTFRGLWSTKQLNESEIDASKIKSITDQLPFKKITLAKYNTQNSIIPPHIDVQPSWPSTLDEYQNIVNNEPAGYRVVLIGGHDSLEVFDNQKWKKAVLPKVPFAYVLNSTKYKHKVCSEPGRQTLYFRGFLDESKHKELIETNLKKYRDLAVFSQ